jgi:hypothetical protein
MSPINGSNKENMSGFRTRKIVKILIVAAIIAALGSLTCLFLWGKLFPYSPMKLGFSRHELSNTIVYVQHRAKFDDYTMIDSYPPAVEKSHELRFRMKPVIYIFRDKVSYLHRSMTKARFCAYPNGSLVVSPWALQEAREGKISLEIYLKHELSHTLLYQHMGIVAAYVYFPRWLLEGIAMYHANQMGTSWYPGEKETYVYISQGNFIDPRDYSTAREERAVLNVKYPIAFIYSEFGCIVDDLITTYGKEKFTQYVKRLSHASSHEKVFREIYGIDFDSFLLDFRKRADEFTRKT